MSTIDGLPAHVLLVHVIVVLVPLTAVLAVLCAVWPAARRRLVWLVAVLGVLTLAVTPLTTSAGEWLEQRVGPTPGLRTHTDRGDAMIYFTAALAIVAVLLVVLHVREGRQPVGRALAGVIAVLTIAASVAAVVQVYRVGDSGARTVWGGVSAVQPASTPPQ
ncbi:DUF2231 domain-containing protein [Nocardia sp. alder85J]|uniref:DUF2231 domain-containing protein n=1 Tax=Nocardia sp. alder85J TaxID=2862949 RepID=UPI001CD6657B|nr:DUF2231 domain-containing protein [Nocardia sp. alder85J]MCX4091314.1 hypothetical protein [Nocardia sp. alder85J]